MVRRAPHAVVALAIALALILAGAGCGSSAAALGTPGSKVRDIDPATVPATLNDLAVSHENIRATLVKGQDTYLSAAGLFSMRRNDVVQATLEVARFNGRARLGDPRFRAAILNDLGGGTPAPVSVGTDTVYLTRGNKQRVYAWFRTQTLMVLSVRDDYDLPRALLRATLGVTA